MVLALLATFGGIFSPHAMGQHETKPEVPAQFIRTSCTRLEAGYHPAIERLLAAAEKGQLGMHANSGQVAKWRAALAAARASGNQAEADTALGRR